MQGTTDVSRDGLSSQPSFRPTTTSPQSSRPTTSSPPSSRPIQKHTDNRTTNAEQVGPKARRQAVNQPEQVGPKARRQAVNQPEQFGPKARRQAVNQPEQIGPKARRSSCKPVRLYANPYRPHRPHRHHRPHRPHRLRTYFAVPLVRFTVASVVTSLPLRRHHLLAVTRDPWTRHLPPAPLFFALVLVRILLQPVGQHAVSDAVPLPAPCRPYGLPSVPRRFTSHLPTTNIDAPPAAAFISRLPASVEEL